MFAAISPMRWIEAALTAAIHADMSWSIVTGSSRSAPYLKNDDWRDMPSLKTRRGAQNVHHVCSQPLSGWDEDFRVGR